MWSAQKAAVVWGVTVLVIGIAIAVATMDHGAVVRQSAFENGQKWGRALAPIVIGVPLIAYFVQKRRLRR